MASLTKTNTASAKRIKATPCRTKHAALSGFLSSALLVMGLSISPVNAMPDPMKVGVTAVEAQNWDKAMAAFSKAAESGNPEAHYHLGALHQHGLGVTKSPSTALKHYKIAAEAGVVEAEHAIGALHHQGLGGLVKDPGKASEWYEKAAQKGSVASMYNLAMMYATGENTPFEQGGNPKNQIAHKWFSLVLDRMEGDEDRQHIQTLIGDLERDMTPGTIERAKAAKVEWLKQHPVE